MLRFALWVASIVNFALEAIIQSLCFAGYCVVQLLLWAVWSTHESCVSGYQLERETFVDPYPVACRICGGSGDVFATDGSGPWTCWGCNETIESDIILFNRLLSVWEFTRPVPTDPYEEQGGVLQ